MKRLALLRHGKSSWDEPELADFDRPLKERGRKAATLIGAELQRRRLHFDMAICSPARRASETAEHLQDGLGSPVELRFDERIYGASAGELLQLVGEVEDEIERLLVVGHNPGLQELSTMLAQAGDPLKARIAAHFPTAAIAVLVLPASRWLDAQPGSGEISEWIEPRRISA